VKSSSVCRIKWKISFTGCFKP